MKARFLLLACGLAAAGLTFGIAATFRSNLILNGLLLLEEALRTLYYLRYEFNLIKVRRLIATGLGGLLVGVGFVLPQYIAYREYCAPSSIQSRVMLATGQQAPDQK